MVSCVVANCDVTKTNNPNNYKFHRIPSRPELFEKWTRIINRPDWTPRKYSTVCSKHFEEKYFIQRRNRTLLMKDAIPTLFVPIKLPQRRLPSAYVNRDIILQPGPSSAEAVSPRKKKLFNKIKHLKKKISEKNTALKNLKAKAKRMNKRILNLEEVVKDLKLLKNFTYTFK